MLRGSLALPLCTVLVLGCASTTPAPAPPAGYDPRAAYDEADENDDGYVDLEEFHRRMVDVFFLGDGDRDGSMTYAEVERVVVVPDDWSQVDTDGDGRIRFHEFVRARMELFDGADVDGDFRLSLEEVQRAYAGRRD
jgi:hypothetical protein